MHPSNFDAWAKLVANCLSRLDFTTLLKSYHFFAGSTGLSKLNTFGLERSAAQ